FPLHGTEAELKITELLSDESVSIIIVNEKILSELDWRLKRRIERTAKPVVISVPDKGGPLVGEDSLKSMIKKALGFELMR
ncbi:MAG: V-type ATP synthase subunit F, partial [Candidatus Diapherotrites archaeon]